MSEDLEKQLAPLRAIHEKRVVSMLKSLRATSIPYKSSLFNWIKKNEGLHGQTPYFLLRFLFELYDYNIFIINQYIDSSYNIDLMLQNKNTEILYRLYRYQELRSHYKRDVDIFRTMFKECYYNRYKNYKSFSALMRKWKRNKKQMVKYEFPTISYPDTLSNDWNHYRIEANRTYHKLDCLGYLMELNEKEHNNPHKAWHFAYKHRNENDPVMKRRHAYHFIEALIIAINYKNKTAEEILEYYCCKNQTLIKIRHARNSLKNIIIPQANSFNLSNDHMAYWFLYKTHCTRRRFKKISDWSGVVDLLKKIEGDAYDQVHEKRLKALFKVCRMQEIQDPSKKQELEDFYDHLLYCGFFDILYKHINLDTNEIMQLKDIRWKKTPLSKTGMLRSNKKGLVFDKLFAPVWPGRPASEKLPPRQSPTTDKHPARLTRRRVRRSTRPTK